MVSERLSISECQRRWSVLRSFVVDLRKIGRSDVALKIEELASTLLLDDINIILHLAVLVWPDFPKNLFELKREDRRSYLGIRPSEMIVHPRLEAMFARGARLSRMNEWQYRIGEWIRECTEKNWYGFFVTLTVDPKIYDPAVTMRDPKVYRDYMLNWHDTIARAIGVKIQRKGGPDVRNYLQSVAVIEHGKSGCHHHMHLLIFCQDIPVDWKKDPNVALISPIRTQVVQPKAWWKYGKIQKCEAFRYIGDRWTKENWIMPKREKLILRPPEACGYYLAKYLDKEKKEWHHRMRATQGLGLTRVKEFLNKMSRDELRELSKRPKTWKQSRRLSESGAPPRTLIARLAKLESFRRDYEGFVLAAHEIKRRPTPILNMLKSVEDGVQPWRMSLPERYEWASRCGAVVTDRSDLFDFLMDYFGDQSYRETKAIQGQ